MINQSFKNYKRQRRTQLSEEKLNKGIKYTDTPLLEGYFKMLVNFDERDSGEALAPRPGLRTNEIGLPPKTIVSGITPVEYDTDMMIMAGKYCAELDNREYKQIIIGKPTNIVITDTALYQGDSYISTVYPENESYESDDSLPDTLLDEVESREIHVTTAVADQTTEYNVFKKPDKAEIHGMSLINIDKIARQVGAFAFNNSYYCFKRTVADGTSKLTYTKLTELAQSNPKRYRYETVEITPKALTSKEAVLWGYNMLSSTPFTFANVNASGNILFHGMLPYDANDKLLLSPLQNQDIYLNCNYTAQIGVKYTFKWEWKEAGATNWVTFGTEDRTIANTNALKQRFSSPIKDVMIRLSAFRWSGEPLAVETIAEQVLAVGFSFNKADYGSTANIEAVSYDLSKASGMAYWKNRLFVWMDNMLFGSEVNNPEYFPYPNNAEIFDETILHGMQFGDYFLIFTTTQIHMLTLSTDGLSWSKKCIQNNLDIKEWDIHLIKVVKNMVFFKSGNYYYMIVPSRLSTGDLVLAPISKDIEQFFDNFKDIITELVQLIYDYEGTLSLIHYYNFLDYEDIHNVYVFQTEKSVYLNCTVLYNTTSRAWRLYFIESQNILVPFKQDATKKGTLMALTPIQITTPLGAVTRPTIQFLKYNKSECSDLYIPASLLLGTDDPLEKLAEIKFFKNYQMIDSGYREHDSDIKKRHREVQLKINNVSQRSLNFYTDFYVDGDQRRSYAKYVEHHELDPTSPNYGTITMEREMVDPIVVPGVTILAEDENEINMWALDMSLFPDAVLWKIRIPVSGKGYAPRMRIISFNEEDYEILNISWIYRLLNSR